ncbi:MAG: crossover junction endodeoxyribonuclease RuvC [Caulobacterales bacterium]|jgi:crossover junction endodeoxyribonuclease RuvC
MGGATKILGIDPGLQRCGWGVLVADGPRLSYLAHGVIKPRTDQSLAERLAALAAGIEAVVADLAPDEAAVEETFVNSNARAALTLGQARGAAMAAAARTGLPVAEYAPSVIKKAVVGSGAADKSQIAFMVKRLLPAAGDVTADAADALAVAICHSAHGGFRKRAGGGAP